MSDKKVGKIKLEEEYIWERHVTMLFRDYSYPTAFQNIKMQLFCQFLPRTGIHSEPNVTLRIFRES
jgi:hypothetical protein